MFRFKHLRSVCYHPAGVGTQYSVNLIIAQTESHYGNRYNYSFSPAIPPETSDLLIVRKAFPNAD